MSLLFDQNLSGQLPRTLASEYPGSTQVLACRLAGADDLAVRTYAIAHGLSIVSKDRDFRDLAVRLGVPPKVVWLRIGNCSTRAIEDLLRDRLEDVTAFLADQTAEILELR